MRIIIFLIAVGVTAAYGQTSKGNLMVGGSMSFQSSKPHDSDNTAVLIASEPTKAFTFSPNVGYFILDNWVAGISSAVTFGKSEYESGATSQISTSLTGIFTRYYFRFGKFGAFPEISYRRGKTKVEYYQPPVNGISFFPDGNTFKADANVGNAKMAVGLAWFIANNVSLEGTVSYSSTYSEWNGSGNTVAATGVNLALQFFIPTKKSKDSSN
ncbi:MAG TPA: hypothetical protein VFE50_22555 [Cyclobacteriaceae bacterium]|nr:hypothetical protein [Cyclobacteriaceae bacterium]